MFFNFGEINSGVNFMEYGYFDHVVVFTHVLKTGLVGWNSLIVDGMGGMGFEMGWTGVNRLEVVTTGVVMGSWMRFGYLNMGTDCPVDC